jgi:hypothetical protein
MKNGKMRYCLKGRTAFWAALSFAVAGLHLTGASASVTAQQQLKALLSEKPENRAILTVGREIFSSVDAVAMLMVWNMTREKTEKEIAFKTDWLNPDFLTRTAAGDPMVTMGSWPEDLRQFFQMALIWVDIQKLNLFVLRPQDILQTSANFTAKKNGLTAGIPDALAREVFSASEGVRTKWVESVLRVRAFTRARGNLERNKNLFSVGWYWHHAPAGLRTTKQ